MGKNSILVLILNLFLVSAASYVSPRMELNGTLTDPFIALKEVAATILNAATPANWDTYMSPATTTGSIGQAQLGNSTISVVMQNWSIPEEFRDQAVKSVRLLALAATEGTYLAQGFVFGMQSTISLTTLLVAVQRIHALTDPDLSVAVLYVTINTNAVKKQLYTPVNQKHCWKCPKCAWVRKCCCKRWVTNEPRGHSPEELYVIKQKMTADQFTWFNEHKTSSNTPRVFFKRSLSNEKNDYPTDLTQVLDKYISKKAVQAEVLASYNDPILNVLQSNITSIKLSSEILKMTKVENKNIDIILTTLAEDYGFDRSNLNTEKLTSKRFSYENLFTTTLGSGNSQLTIKYIWIVGQKNDNSTYTIHFLHSNITSQLLIQTLSSNNTDNNEGANQLKIVRTSTLNDNGEFLGEHFSNYITPWQMKTTIIALNILRFIGASKFVPQNRYRMLSHFNPEIISPETKSNIPAYPESRALMAKVMALAQAVSTITSTFKEIVNTFKSSSSTTITRIIRFGFNYFNQKSKVLKVMDIPAARADEFIRAVIVDYNLPSKGSFMLGLTYSDDFAWDSIQYLYSPSMNGAYRSLTLFKNGDSVKNTSSFFIVDIDANWDLAPDLLIITKSKSMLGGLWSSTKQSIQEVPHVLTLDEATKLQQFFMIIAIGNMGNTFGLNVTYPQLT